MATIDSNGVLFYQDTDNYTPIQTALNLAQSNLSDLLSGKPRFERTANEGTRAALVQSIGAANISKANPLLVWRADAADGLQLEYTTNGTTWRTIADKQYYDSQDIGWSTLTVPDNWWITAFPVQVRRIGTMVYFRGILQAAEISPVDILAPGVIPAGLRPVGGNPVFPVANTVAASGRVTVSTAGGMNYSGAIAAGQYIYLNSISYPST